MRPDDTGTPTQEESNSGNMKTLDDIIDTIADRYIHYDMGGDVYDGGTDHHLYTDDDDPWVWVTTKPVDSYAGSPAEAKQVYLQSGKAADNGDDSWTIQTQSGAVTTNDVWVKKGGARWKEVRSWFEGIKKPYETALSFKQNAFIAPRVSLELAVKDLVPAGEISDADVDDLSKVDVSNAGQDPSFGDDLERRLSGNDAWDDARTADRFLQGWQGRGAQIFKWTFLERLPSILVGQATTAKALKQSVDILSKAYTNVRNQSIERMFDAQDIFELYPFHNSHGAPEGMGWAKVINGVAGIAEDVGQIAGWIPHPKAQAVAAGADTVSEAAKLLTEPLPLIGVTIVKSPKHTEIVSEPVKIEGSKTYEIYDNWYKQITAFIETVLNSEEVIGQNLTEYTSYIDETKQGESGASLETTYGDTVQLSRYHSFFCAPAPGKGAFTPNSRDGMGNATPNGDTGNAFAGDLNELFKAATTSIPETAWTYGHQNDSGDISNMKTDTTRTTYESVPGSGGPTYAGSSQGAAFQPWMDLYARFNTMMKDSEKNLLSAAELLKAAAVDYGKTDGEAADGLDSQYRELIDKS